MQDSITVRDRHFRISIPDEQIAQRVNAVAAAISKDLEGEKPLFLAVLNGSFVFAADLLRGITIPCEISFVRLASYEGTTSTGKVRELIGLNENIEGRTIVVVEDIIDSGLTMKEMLNMLQAHKPKDIRIASLLVKPGNLKVALDDGPGTYKIVAALLGKDGKVVAKGHDEMLAVDVASQHSGIARTSAHHGDIA